MYFNKLLVILWLKDNRSKCDGQFFTDSISEGRWQTVTNGDQATSYSYCAIQRKSKAVW